MSDEASIAKTFCGCDYIQQRIERLDVANTCAFNNAVSNKNGVYQRFVSALLTEQSLKAKDEINQ
ncbi:hypothetical protein GCM10011338_14930 [Alteromonas lipolytica]|nr:hypothetical protein GCM10011338_14930 [Alteromonas lipolytica]